MTVRVATVEAPERHGGWTPDVDRRLAALESPVRRLLESAVDSLPGTDRITVVPDTHYPFHPSTGVVTDPAVVGSIVGCLERRTDADVAVAGTSDDRIAFDRTADYLGYPSMLDRFDADLVDLAGEPRADPVVTVDEGLLSVSVPERLLESAVVVVPSLRPTETGHAAGGMRTLARTVGSAAGTDRTAVAATRAVDPAVAVLDATTAYGGDPVAMDALFAGPTPRVDGVAASLLDRPVENDAVIRAALEDGESITVDSVDPDADAGLDALRRRLPDGGLPPSDDTPAAVATAYRIYAAIAGDAVPPQLERGH